MVLFLLAVLNVLIEIVLYIQLKLSVPKNTFFNYQNQGQSGKRKKEEKNQIRIFLYQLYPIYSIKKNYKLLKKK